MEDEEHTTPRVTGQNNSSREKSTNRRLIRKTSDVEKILGDDKERSKVFQ